MKKLREQETLGNISELNKRMLNDRLMFAERGFLDPEGLQGRQWFKHLVRVICSLIEKRKKNYCLLLIGKKDYNYFLTTLKPIAYCYHWTGLEQY